MGMMRATRDIEEALDTAARARVGDSNDEEIEALWHAVGLMADFMGMVVPEYEAGEFEE